MEKAKPKLEDHFEIKAVAPRRNNGIRLTVATPVYSKAGFVAGHALGKVPEVDVGDESYPVRSVTSTAKEETFFVTIQGEEGDFERLEKAFGAGKIRKMKPSRLENK